MPIIWDAEVEPDDLTYFIREMPVPGDFALLAENETEFYDDNTIDWGEITRVNRTARYRSFDGRVHVSSRDTASDKRVRLLPLSSSLSLGEYERLQQEFARTGGTRVQALERAIYNDGEKLTREVFARLEQAWGDVYTDGKLTISENGFAGEADYGVPGNHLVAPSTAWTNTASATVLTDIETWTQRYVATNNGQRPGRLRTSQARLNNVVRNKEVIDAIYGATAGRTRVNISEVNDLLANENLPTFELAYDGAVDVDGVTVRTIPEDRVIMRPANLRELGHTAMGLSATALELVNSANSDLDFEEAPGIVGVVFKEDGVPFRQHTYVDAVGMPVLTDARKLLIADVA